MPPTTWPSELADVQPSAYLNAIIFEFIAFIVVVILVLLSIQRYRERMGKPTFYLILFYSGIAFALLMTVIAKSLIYFWEVEFLSAHYFDKIALIGLLSSHVALLLFDSNIFTQIEFKKGVLLLSIYTSVAFLPLVIELFMRDHLTAFTSVWILGVSLIPYSLHIKWAHDLSEMVEDKMPRLGIRLILIQGICLIAYIILVLTSSIFIVADLLRPFNFLYYMSQIFLIGALFSSYLGHFLPTWFQSLYSRFFLVSS